LKLWKIAWEASPKKSGAKVAAVACGEQRKLQWRGGKSTTAAAATLINDSTWLWSRFRASAKDQRLNVCQQFAIPV